MSEYVMWVVAALLFLAVAGSMWLIMRRQYIKFTEKVCYAVDQIIQGTTDMDFDLEKDTLLSKMQWKLKQLCEITEAAAKDNVMQREQMQSIVSDISHQIKTPVANVSMYCDTALNPELPIERQEECLQVMRRQIDKLEFLVQSLIKMSRLEQNIIMLKPEQSCLYETLHEVTESVRLRAEQKNLTLELKCPQELMLSYDPKWTAEALFNVLDNGVKYTPSSGTIRIFVEPMNIYTKVCISDTGVGIPQDQINNVCKRFYRGDNVRKEDGVGIGLYLTKEIVMKQNGYIKITSKEGGGTEVSLYFWNG